MCVGPLAGDNAGAKRAILYYGVEYFISFAQRAGADAAVAVLFVRSDKVRESAYIVKYEQMTNVSSHGLRRTSELRR